MTYRAPVRDIAFALNAVAGIEDVAATGAFPDYDPDVAAAVLEAAGQFSEEVLAPLNRPGDLQGAKYANGAVTAAPGFAGFLHSLFNSIAHHAGGCGHFLQRRPNFGRENSQLSILKNTTRNRARPPPRGANVENPVETVEFHTAKRL